MESEERLICVSDGTPQLRYIGKTDLSNDSILERVQANKVIRLTEARCLRTILAPAPAGGFGVQCFITGIDHCTKSIPIWIKPTSFFFADDASDADVEGLNKLIEACEKIEVQHRAEAAGLVTPDGMRRLQS